MEFGELKKMTLMINPYFIDLSIKICIYFILAASLQLAMGYGGIFSMGHVSFFGIGAYASALLTLMGMPFSIAIIYAGFIPAVFALLLSLPTQRLKKDYLAITTLSFSYFISTVLLNWTSVTGGPYGVLGIIRPTIFGISTMENNNFLLFSFILAIGCYIFIHRMVSSPLGNVIEACRDDELAAKSLGKNVFRVKTIIFMISAFIAGIAGCLFAHYVLYIDPFVFTFNQLIPIFLITIIGGVASLKGTAIATVIIILLPEPLRFIGLPNSFIGPFEQIIFAITLISILYFKPKGLYGRMSLD